MTESEDDTFLDDLASDSGQVMVQALVSEHVSPRIDAVLPTLCCDRHRQAFIRGASIRAASYFICLAVANDGDPTNILEMVVEAIRRGEAILDGKEDEDEPEPTAPSTETVQ